MEYWAQFVLERARSSLDSFSTTTHTIGGGGNNHTTLSMRQVS